MDSFFLEFTDLLDRPEVSVTSGGRETSSLSTTWLWRIKHPRAPTRWPRVCASCTAQLALQRTPSTRVLSCSSHLSWTPRRHVRSRKTRPCGSKGMLAFDGVTGRSVQGHIEHAEHVYTRFRLLPLARYTCNLTGVCSYVCQAGPSNFDHGSYRLVCSSIHSDKCRFTLVQYSFFMGPLQFEQRPSASSSCHVFFRARSVLLCVQGFGMDFSRLGCPMRSGGPPRNRVVQLRTSVQKK